METWSSELGNPVTLTAGIAAAGAPVGAVVGARWWARWGTHRSPWVGAALEDVVAIALARWADSGHAPRWWEDHCSHAGAPSSPGIGQLYP